MSYLWIRPANVVGSSRLNPDVSSDVSYKSQMRSVTVLSLWSAAACNKNNKSRQKK